MPNGVIGLNILGDRAFDKNALIVYVQQLQPAYCVVLNNPALAAQLTAYTRVIVRRTPDDSAQDGLSGKVFVQSRRAEVPSGGYLYLGNEPLASQKLNDWTLAAQAEAGPSLKLCILNLATGNPEPEEWELLRPCVENAIRRGDLIGLHEYFYQTAMRDYPYQFGRFQVFKRLFPQAQTVITEHAAVNLKNGQFDAYAGWDTYLDELHYMLELDGTAASYADYGIGVCIFSWPEWDAYGFDISQATSKLLPQLIKTNQRYKVVTPPPAVQPPAVLGAPLAATVNATLGLRVHPTPDVFSALLRILPYQANVTEYPSNIKEQGANTFVFVHDADGKPGWVAMQFLTPVDAPPKFSFHAPFAPYKIVSRFNDPRDYSKIAPDKLQLHEGTDFEPADGSTCDPVVHVGAAGKVLQVSVDPPGYGNFILVDFGNDFSAIYAHFAEVWVKAGQTLVDGQIIGLQGATGNASEPHVHISLSNPTIGANGYVYPSVVDLELYLAK